eukprot:CAMPEP_0117687992 /NCGR_PEP_ID=MMETSP0804-20121206/23519_1 /TAXON_ID=1074897 /ORGANISM="Tetraselmis astigmatica, Strain CCMP880" /LENGTH=64 /DNA_ID=CAMNT_0005500269 /DNA_START=1 /DNA_END=191 /DNA_ORIENTATION=-
MGQSRGAKQAQAEAVAAGGGAGRGGGDDEGVPGSVAETEEPLPERPGVGRLPGALPEGASGLLR